MLLGRVIGTVWATRKDERLEGMKLLVVQEVDLSYKPVSRFVICVDAVEAGVGEIVLVAQGSSARMTRLTKDTAVDAVIMAIVDSLAVRSEAELVAAYESRRQPILDRLAAQPEL